MQKFLKQAEEKIAVVEEEMNKIDTIAKELATKYGEDVESFKPDEFLSLVNHFLEALEKARIENERIKEEELRKEKASRKLAINKVGAVKKIKVEDTAKKTSTKPFHVANDWLKIWYFASF